ncbi:MAG: DNA-3-methyladenine glycosylase [Acidobacteriota bacterium]|nr:DNA-3-methyladenine glycosylase [Acidobacteriota bacterium]MDQ5838040.1 DNA-3-methyladenine glycosylase [Acidobacteriota bacterium]
MTKPGAGEGREVRRGAKLRRDFYTRGDATAVALSLLGRLLVVPAPNGARVSGRIVEVEAYCGVEDRASHAYGGRRTARTETMYAEGGVAYVYFVYGMHHQFNVVTGPKELPHAVLVRAVEPSEGVEWMRRRRPVRKESELTSGPGKLCQALGIDRSFDGANLLGRRVWIEETGSLPSQEEVAAGARIGVAYAGADALKPWRFWLKGNEYVSRKTS